LPVLIVVLVVIIIVFIIVHPIRADQVEPGLEGFRELPETLFVFGVVLCCYIAAALLAAFC
jgi:hypothetical protein